MENKLTLLATKQDLKDEVHRLEVMMSENKSETIKWMFIFWISQFAAMFGFLLLFVKK